MLRVTTFYRISWCNFCSNWANPFCLFWIAFNTAPECEESQCACVKAGWTFRASSFFTIKTHPLAVLVTVFQQRHASGVCRFAFSAKLINSGAETLLKETMASAPYSWVLGGVFPPSCVWIPQRRRKSIARAANTFIRTRLWSKGITQKRVRRARKLFLLCVRCAFNLPTIARSFSLRSGRNREQERKANNASFVLWFIFSMSSVVYD